MTQAGGTVRWEAPELMDELEDGTAPRPTPLSDVYSAASVMYEVNFPCATVLGNNDSVHMNRS